MIDFIVLVMATWRLTSIVQREKVAAVFRRLFGEKYDPMLLTETYPDTFLGHLIQCFWCVSVWCGLVCAVVYIYDPRYLLPLAASAFAIVIDKVI